MHRSYLSTTSNPREPQLLRFRLRHMFLGVTAVSLFCGLVVSARGAWPIVIGTVTLLGLAHVLGNLIGTRLRDTSHDVVRWRTSKSELFADHPRITPREVEISSLNLPQESPLAGRNKISRWLKAWVVGGTLVGAIAGSTMLALTIGWRIGWAGFLVGAISFAVLGCWLAFLAYSFSSISRHAWREATGKGS